MKMRNLIFIAGMGFVLSGCLHARNAVTTTQTEVEQTVADNEKIETATGSAVRETSNKIEISYTESGFNPARLIVKRGTRVTFTNQSSEMMWVASDPHPVHSDLRAFNQFASSGKGSTYTYTFELAGEWSYHNHEAPSHTGVIIVE